jgi:hypothetical protein
MKSKGQGRKQPALFGDDDMFEPMTPTSDKLTPQIMRDPVAINRFVTAGKAMITLTSEKTQARFTYRVSKIPDADDKFFVGVMTSKSNEDAFTYIGLLEGNRFRRTQKAKLSENATPVKGFKYFCEHVLENGHMPEQLSIRHEGRCGRCSKPLTVPESIDRGFGPICWEEMGGDE